MVISEIVDSIAGQFEKELDHVFKRQVRTNIVIARAEAIRQYIDKYGAAPSSFISQINFQPTVEVDITEACDEADHLDIPAYKTVNKIPNPIRTRGLNNSFSYVGPVDNSKPYSFVLDPSDIPFLLTDKFLTKCNPPPVFYTYVNGHIYVLNEEPDEIRVRGVFSDVDAVATLNKCEGNCPDVFTIPDDLVMLIKDMVYKEMRNTPIVPSNEEIELKDNPTQ